MKKTIFTYLTALTLLCSFGPAFGQGNLIDSSTWTVGQPTDLTPGFKQLGGADQNIIEEAPNPFGQDAPVWRMAPNAPNVFKGLETVPDFTTAQIDTQSDYRFSVWVKIFNGNGGKPITLLRGPATIDFLDANGNPGKDPYFNWGNAPAADTWYLMVGFVKGMTSTTDYEATRGYYNVQGVRVANLSGPAPYRFNTTTSEFSVVCGFNNTGGTGENMLYYAPRFEKVDGSEPTIQELTNGVDDPVGGGGAWTTNNNGIHYGSGNVGIGTTAPDAPLTVKGHIHAQEVTVDLNGAVAPDYVFYDDYALRSLEEVQRYIDLHGHLPNIPSAKEMETEGVHLKTMNLKLLEKIEELTLYVMEQDSIQEEQFQLIRQQQAEQQRLRQRIAKLEDQQ